MSKNSNISKIRIDGFNQSWVKKRLGDVLKHEQSWKYIESSTKYFNHGIPVLTPGKSFVLGYTKDTKNIKKASENSPIILFDDFTTQSRFINFDFKVRSSALKLLINKNPKDNLHFHYLILQKIKYNARHHGRHWLPLFVNFTFFQPDWSEQQKISQLFETLENLVYKLEEKINMLKNLKNNFSYKMFVDLSSDFPLIRFRGFNQPWKNEKITDLFQTYKNNNLENLKLISYSISNKLGFVSQKHFFKNGGKAIFADKRNSQIITKDSFAFNPSTIRVGSLALYKNSTPGLISPMYEAFKLKKEYNSDYFLIWFKTEIFKKLMLKSTNKSVRHIFRLNQIEEYFIKVADTVEQQKISQLFETFDSLILVYEKKVAYFQKIKQTLLNKMFI
ncbi:restriction endonuclease subunit S [Mesomycoplasma ovipneumoniae]|uniref:restriction endonuclease subunit S n=1 Tax=Mesomycoplasma ovipneumoniae TaxID=29562 RepID=UPI002963E853|nr:restriction endonuclease subunit S [Mesomycoplasma ovipneumoniae]MDW2835237.1 restriction endonuclease subunit S [Mesomycoplasma ovipneumoniae]